MQHAAIDAVIDAVESDRIPESRVDAAVQRIFHAKRTYRTGYVAGEDEWNVAAADCRAVARTIAERGVTLVRDDVNALPLSDQPVSLYEFEPGRGSLAEESRDKRGTLASALSAAGVSTDATVLGSGDVSKTKTEGGARDDADTPMIVHTSDAVRNPGQAAVIRDFVVAGANPIVVATRSPYDLTSFPDIETYLTTYDDTEASLVAAAEVLAGTRKPTGRLPVTVPNVDE